MPDWKEAGKTLDAVAGVGVQMAVPKLEGQLTDADTDPTVSRMKAMQNRASGTPSPHADEPEPSLSEYRSAYEKRYGKEKASEDDDLLAEARARMYGGSFTPKRTGGFLAKTIDLVTDELVAGAAMTLNTAVNVVNMPAVGLIGLGKLALGQDVEDVARDMEKMSLRLAPKDPQAKEYFEKSEETFNKIMAVTKPLSDWWRNKFYKPQPIHDEKDQVVAWTQPEASWAVEFGAAAFDIGPWLLLGEAGGKVMGRGKGQMKSVDFARYNELARESYAKDSLNNRSKSLLLDELNKAEARAKESEILDTTTPEQRAEAKKAWVDLGLEELSEGGVDETAQKSTPKMENILTEEAQKVWPGQEGYSEGVTKFRREGTPKDSHYLPKDEKVVYPEQKRMTGKGQERYVYQDAKPDPHRYLAKDELVVEYPETPLPESEVVTEPTYIDVRRGAETKLFDHFLPRDELVVEPKGDTVNTLKPFKKQTGVTLSTGGVGKAFVDQIERAGRTMRSRVEPARLIKDLYEKGVKLAGRVLHSGRGKDVPGTAFLKEMTNGKVLEYDPNVKGIDKMPEGSFDAVVQNYVLNTVEPDLRTTIIKNVADSLAPNGQFIVSVRSVKDAAAKGGKGWNKVSDGWMTSKGTFQKFYTQKMLFDELKPHFDNVTILTDVGGEGSIVAVAKKGGEAATLYSGGTVRQMGRGLKKMWDNKTQKQIENNASGESSASLEAIRRLMKQKDMLFARVNINNLRQLEPIAATVDRVDVSAGKNNLIIAKKMGDPRLMLVDAGANLTQAQIKRAMQDLHNRSQGGKLFNKTVTTLYSQGGFHRAAEIMKQAYEAVKNTEMLDKMEDFFYIEPRFQRIGAHETAFHVKNTNSLYNAIVEAGAKKLVRMADKVGWRPEYLRDAVLIAETPSLMEQYAGTLKGEAARYIRAEMDNARTILNDHGINVNFKERIRRTITDKLDEAIAAGDRPKVAQYRQSLEKLQDFEFVHIPKSMWFEDMIQNPRTHMKAIRFLNTTRRRTLRISDLARFMGNDISMIDVMSSYYHKLGNDVAIAKVMKAAREEGLMTTDRNAAAELGFVQLPAYEAPAFSKFYMHRVLRDTLHSEYISKVKPSVLNQMTSVTKMLTFDQPWYLGYYNLQQAAMLRGWWNLPGILMDTAKAVKMIKENHPEVMLAKENGLQSHPYPHPFQEAMASVQSLKRGWGGRFVDMFKENLHPIEHYKKGKGLGKIPFVPELYGLLWDAAWQLFDFPVRLGTYNHLRGKGFDIRNSAQTAALYHGDYAAVPRSTRVMLNKALYTPTFKIAMAKLHGRLIRDAIMGESSVKYAGLGRKMAATGLASILLTNMAMDMWMTEGLGFERESWGRRYRKQVETENGVEDFYVTMSHPQNLLPKYAERFVKPMLSKEPGALWRFIKSNKYELTPLILVVNDVLKNQSPEGKIYNDYDDKLVKARKAIGHGIRSISSFVDATFPTHDSAQTKKAFINEVGFGAYLLLNTVTSQYLGSPEFAKKNARSKNAQRMFKADIDRMIERNEFSSEKLNMILRNYLRDLNDVWKD